MFQMWQWLTCCGQMTNVHTRAKGRQCDGVGTLLFIGPNAQEDIGAGKDAGGCAHN